MTVNDVRSGVMDKLRALFPDVPVTGGDIAQDGERPAISVKLASTAQRQLMGRRYRRTYSFAIRYFEPAKNDEALHDAAERLYGELERIAVPGGGFVRGTGMRHEIAESALHFFIDVHCHIFRTPESEETKMRTLKQRGHFTNG